MDRANESIKDISRDIFQNGPFETFLNTQTKVSKGLESLSNKHCREQLVKNISEKASVKSSKLFTRHLELSLLC